MVDDSLLPRLAARALLAEAKDMRLLGEVASGDEALKAASRLKPDVVLMDVHMPGMDGPETTAKLLKELPATKVIAWTVSESSDDLLRMMQAGCSGYVLKDVGPSELQRAIWAAVRSESPVPRKMIPDVLRRVAVHAPPPEASSVSLTSREMQVLRGLARGWSTKRISREIGLKIPTVETHLGNLYRKLGVGNRGEAVSAGLRLNLISLADV
ncbi:MAG TPA: response regulator transcription factor [Candidatus Dormibacteraeota bacterium]|nr:response regulator transcription factor [Candidatus Dormibacteraeota bacterium]